MSRQNSINLVFEQIAISLFAYCNYITKTCCTYILSYLISSYLINTYRAPLALIFRGAEAPGEKKHLNRTTRCSGNTRHKLNIIYKANTLDVMLFLLAVLYL